MGTSALDGAKLGLPTVVIDASYNIFPESYKYRWIYEADEYGLGKMIELEQGYEGGIHSMDMLLNSISLAWAEVSKKSQSYVKNNYNVCNVVDMLIKAKDTSNLRINYFRDLLYIRYLRILRNLGIR
jgi:hypothetical protein